jgi:hypothetical protein
LYNVQNIALKNAAHFSKSYCLSMFQDPAFSVANVASVSRVRIGLLITERGKAQEVTRLWQLPVA